MDAKAACATNLTPTQGQLTACCQYPRHLSLAVETDPPGPDQGQTSLYLWRFAYSIRIVSLGL